MAINVNAANNQAAQLSGNITQLRNAKNQLQSYKTSISNSWQGKEVTYFVNAIDQVIGEIDSVIGNIDSLSYDIKNTAAQIKREEDAAAAAAARAAKQARINEAQSKYDDACDVLEDLLKQKEKLDKKMKKASLLNKISLLDDEAALALKIQEARTNCDNAYNALRAAKG